MIYPLTNRHRQNPCACFLKCNGTLRFLYGEGCMPRSQPCCSGRPFNEACVNFDFAAFLSNCRDDHFTSHTVVRTSGKQNKTKQTCETLMGSLSLPPDPAGEGGRFQKLLRHLCATGRAACQLEQHLVSSFLVFIAVKIVSASGAPHV